MHRKFKGIPRLARIHRRFVDVGTGGRVKLRADTIPRVSDTPATRNDEPNDLRREARDRPMSGKVCLVTGATSGIGRVTAAELARLGASVVLVGRGEARGAEAVAAIRRETGNVEVEFLAADLSSQAEVRRLAARFSDRHDRLHVLLNNAGALFALRRESVDGIEMTLALNHLGPFLLTNLLLDTLVKSSPSRIVNVASSAHADVAGFDFDDPQACARSGKRRSYPRSEWSSFFYTIAIPWAHPGYVRYAESKLANLLFTLELAARLEGTGVTVNALHPGLVATPFLAGNGSYGWFMRRWWGLFGMSADKGARTSVHLATSPEVARCSGLYFVEKQPVAPSTAALDRAAARRLWELSEELAGFPDARDGKLAGSRTQGKVSPKR
jgi:NAD(P)-dependent dehydrogenase (short-subunit alcohol dehydrogenase family)